VRTNLVRRRLAPLAVVSATALVLAACGGDDDSSDNTSTDDTENSAQDSDDSSDEMDDDTAEGSDLSADLLGAGATFPEPLYLEWIGAYREVQSGVSINYQGVGSGGGVEQFIAQTTDFGGSDAFLTDDEVADAEAARSCDTLHVPTVFGAVAVAYNLPDVEGLVLDSDALAAIFLGEITTYDDPAIVALNPDLDLPSTDIVVAHRSDGSGTSSIFTTYLDDVSSDWSSQVGAGKEVEWPTGVGGQGNDGVAAAIQQNEGGLGYVELSFAIENDLPVASMMNADGNAIEPSLESTSAAAGGIEIPEDLRFNLLGVGGDGYPIAGATWVLAYTCGYDEAKAEALKDFLTWAITDADDIAESLLYSPIAGDLEQAALANIELINSEG
jgi:phosphate transport system substrate-binding protein